MPKNSKYRYFFIAAAAVAAVVLIILFASGKLDGVLNDLETVSSDGGSSSIAESSVISSSDIVSESGSEPNSSAKSEKSSRASVSSSSKPNSGAFSSKPQSSSTPTRSTLRFRNKNLLNQHYEKHGIDMGFSSAAEYEAAAAKVPNDPNALHKIEKEDGDDIYYIEATNEFVVVSTDGYIRTYFNPDRGIDYFNRQ